MKTTVPDQINKLLQGVPTTVEVKGLQLNTSLVQDPEVTPDRLIVRDWGRFKNPSSVSEVSKALQQAMMQLAASLHKSDGVSSFSESFQRSWQSAGFFSCPKEACMESA